MSQDYYTTSRQPGSSTYGSSASGRDSMGAGSDEWSAVQDPGERRKIQNKLAQRRFRDKIREQKEDAERQMENQRRAGGSYASPEPDKIDHGHELSGLPWGGISMKHIMQAGRQKEQSSQHSSQDNSVYTSHTGGSSR